MDQSNVIELKVLFLQKVVKRIHTIILGCLKEFSHFSVSSTIHLFFDIFISISIHQIVIQILYEMLFFVTETIFY